MTSVGWALPSVVARQRRGAGQGEAPCFSATAKCAGDPATPCRPDPQGLASSLLPQLGHGGQCVLVPRQTSQALPPNGWSPTAASELGAQQGSPTPPTARARKSGMQRPRPVLCAGARALLMDGLISHSNMMPAVFL